LPIFSHTFDILPSRLLPPFATFCHSRHPAICQLWLGAYCRFRA
jgi:hypothetical protein